MVDKTCEDYPDAKVVVIPDGVAVLAVLWDE